MSTKQISGCGGDAPSDRTPDLTVNDYSETRP